ncbi:MAG TPA: hypothetical protein VGC09_07450 [Rhodopila sp.]
MILQRTVYHFSTLKRHVSTGCRALPTDAEFIGPHQTSTLA